MYIIVEGAIFMASTDFFDLDDIFAGTDDEWGKTLGDLEAAKNKIAARNASRESIADKIPEMKMVAIEDRASKAEVPSRARTETSVRSKAEVLAKTRVKAKAPKKTEMDDEAKKTEAKEVSRKLAKEPVGNDKSELSGTSTETVDDSEAEEGE